MLDSGALETGGLTAATAVADAEAEADAEGGVVVRTGSPGMPGWVAQPARNAAQTRVAYRW